jgi:predicted PurR-regulated permease PerM
MRRDLILYLAEHGLHRIALLVQTRVGMDLGNLEVTSLVNYATDLVGFATLAALVAFFGLLERSFFSRRLSGSRRANQTWQRILADTQRYLGIKSATSALTGLVAGAACWLVGLPNAPLWGAIAFWLNYLPVVGSILAALPPLLIALATQDASAAISVGVAYLAINMLIGNYLEPKWHGTAAGLSALAVIISIASWGALLGPLGALLAVPLTMTIKIWCYHTPDLSWLARLLGETELHSEEEFEPRPSLFSMNGGRRAPDSPRRRTEAKATT